MHTHLAVVKRAMMAVVLIGATVACEQKEEKKFTLYEGPLEVIKDVHLQVSEEGKEKVTMQTGTQLRYRNDNKVYPDSIFINFYNPEGTSVMTTLRADSGRYDNAQKLYTVMGKVHIINIEKREHTFTEELNWSPQTKKVYSEKHVLTKNLMTGGVMEGDGMDADQSFKQIILRKARGRDYMNVN